MSKKTATLVQALRQCASVRDACAGLQRSFRPLLFSEPPSTPSLPSRIAGKTNVSWVGRLLPCSQSSRFRLEVGTARVRLPRPCRPLTKRRPGWLVLARQLLIGHATTDHLGKRTNESATIVGSGDCYTETPVRPDSETGGRVRR